MEAVGISIGAGLGTFAIFGGIALLMWIDSRNKRHERDLKHAERLKALELGQPLPDVEVARAHAEQTRWVFLGLICFLVPIGLAGIAVGATALVLKLASPNIHLPLLCVIWGVVGAVGVVAVTGGLQAMLGVKPHAEEEAKDQAPPDKLAERIKEHTLQV